MYDLYVTVSDLNTADHKVVANGVRINTNETISVSVQPDGNGDASIHWSATEAGATDPKTKEDDATPRNGDVLSISTY